MLLDHSVIPFIVLHFSCKETLHLIQAFGKQGSRNQLYILKRHAR